MNRHNASKLIWVLLCTFCFGACRSENATPGPGGESGGGVGTGGSGGAAGSPAPQAVTIVTWNVHLLVNHQFDGGLPNEIKKNSLAEYEEHRAAVGKVLAAIDADVVVLQEVEHLKVLGELNDEELGSRYEHLVLEDANDPSGIDIALLSKLPIEDVVSHADDTFTKVGTQGPTYQYVRDCLEVHIDYNGRSLVLLGVHYKAKYNDNPDLRLAEAQHTRAIADAITAAEPATGLLILGDFNDIPGSFAYDWTIGSEPDQYRNAADHAPASDRWTFTFEGAQMLVDQQMSNPLLAAMLNTSSVAIWHTSDVDDASDHAPVVATYEVN